MLSTLNAGQNGVATPLLQYTGTPMPFSLSADSVKKPFGHCSAAMSLHLVACSAMSGSIHHCAADRPHAVRLVQIGHVGVGEQRRIQHHLVQQTQHELCRVRGVASKQSIRAGPCNTSSVTIMYSLRSCR